MVSPQNALLIIPTYNEIINIEKMIKTIDQLYPKLNLLIIDDGSPDKTGDYVKIQQQSKNNLYLIERTGKLGLGTAYIKGFKWAIEKGYQAIVTMDCDFSHDPKDIEGMLELIEPYDLVTGSRYINGIRIINWPMHRLLLSYFASVYARIITGIPLLDSTGGFNAYSRKALMTLDLDRVFSIGYAFQIELKFKIWSKKLNIKEYPIVFSERTEGKSKMSRKIIFEAVVNVFILRFKKLIGTL